MLYYALLCLVVGLTAAGVDLDGAVQISWILFLISGGLVALHLIPRHWTGPVTRRKFSVVRRYTDDFHTFHNFLRRT